jgi:fatty acid-binding protein DegV
LYVHASSQIFDTTNLVKAKQKLIEKYPERKFELIDSKNFSSGYGAVCFALAIMYKSGMSIEEIMKEDYKLIDSMACYMVVDSLESISNYGVIDTNAVIGTALNIKSIIAIDIDGKLKLIEKISGRKRAISKLVQLIRQTGQNIVDNPISALVNANYIGILSWAMKNIDVVM